MHPFRTILFAADFSENSKEAFRLASSLARENKTRLFVLHVIGSDQVAEERALLGQPAAPPLTQKDQEPHGSVRQKLRESYTPNHPVDVVYDVREGDIPAEVLRMAAEVGADLIALGTHGRTGLRRLLVGSVATAVLRGAHCPVLALRSAAGARPGRPVQVILHPTDFSASSAAALRVARALAGDLAARLILLHVVPVTILMDGSMAAEIDPQPYRDALEKIREALDGPDMKYPIETRLMRGFEQEEIRRAAEEVACDLIVMGTHGRTGLGRLFMGSVAESVLSRADCPVMVVRVTQPVPSDPKKVIVF
jgi:nucleotide-binding universal stress UspA family protein